MILAQGRAGHCIGSGEARELVSVTQDDFDPDWVSDLFLSGVDPKRMHLFLAIPDTWIALREIVCCALKIRDRPSERLSQILLLWTHLFIPKQPTAEAASALCLCHFPSWPILLQVAN